MSTSARLRVADAALIRMDDRSHAAIAAEYGVSRQAISAIKAGRSHRAKTRIYPLDAERSIQRGEIVEMGKHRLMCGDCTNPDDVAALMPDGPPRLLLADPPYSSGAFQEAARTQTHSKGTKGPQWRMTGDMRSTRGFQHLVRSALSLAVPEVAYVFTDWRMWSYLWDAVEQVGLSVRSMIVWDKLYPGQGHGWRSQHELILAASIRSNALPRGGVGNVLRVKRERNEWSQTQKPQELLRRLLEMRPRSCESVYDPFVGGGSTILAAERAGLTFYGMEIDPLQTMLAIERWRTRG